MQLSVFQLPIHSFVSIKMNAVKWLDSIGVAHIKGRAVVAFPDFCSMKKRNALATTCILEAPPCITSGP